MKLQVSCMLQVAKITMVSFGYSLLLRQTLVLIPQQDVTKMMAVNFQYDFIAGRSPELQRLPSDTRG